MASCGGIELIYIDPIFFYEFMKCYKPEKMDAIQNMF